MTIKVGGRPVGGTRGVVMTVLRVLCVGILLSGLASLAMADKAIAEEDGLRCTTCPNKPGSEGGTIGGGT